MAVYMETMGKIQSMSNPESNEDMAISSNARMDVNANIIQNNVLSSAALHLAFTKLAGADDGTDKQ